MNDDYEVTKLEVAKLELKEGDILAVRILHRSPSDDDIARVEKHLRSILPAGVKSIIYNADYIELSIVSKPGGIGMDSV